MVYVGDVVDAALRACVVPAAAGEEMIVAGPRAAPLSEILEVLARVVGRAKAGPRLPLAPMMALAAVTEDTGKFLGIKPPIYRRRMDFYRNDAAFDCSRAMRVLGWKPQVDLEEGFRRTLESYRRGPAEKREVRVRRELHGFARLAALLADLGLRRRRMPSSTGPSARSRGMRPRASPPPKPCCSASWTSRARRRTRPACARWAMSSRRSSGHRLQHALDRAAGRDEARGPPGRRDAAGKRGKRLLLLGHLDTVLSGERFRREGTRAYGTGTADMKGGCRRDAAGAESAA